MNQINMNNISYPVKITDIDKFETLNSISVNVFGLDDNSTVFSLRISIKDDAEHHVNLLYFAEEEISHYALINDLSRLVSAQINNHNGRQYICKYCLHGCSSQEILDNHTERCQLHGAQRVKLPEPEENNLYLKKYECQLRLPFVIYADFESILLKHHTCDQQSDRTWTIKKHTHEACGFGLYTLSTDKRFYSKPKIHSGPDSAEAFLDAVTREAHQIRKYLKNKIAMKRLTPQQWNEYRDASICHICEKEIIDEQKKVRDHDHLTGINFKVQNRSYIAKMSLYYL